MAASKIIRSCLFALCAIFLSSCAALHPNKSGGSGENRCLLIVLDGLRPDYVTPALMPNLFALGKGG
ncbi:hypothetical protein HYR69_10425, partial [Candidatus Sumerlaeota bacterium]|nr:hypothetical protein [Candidatus Sumerlaeota bacterium]